MLERRGSRLSIALRLCEKPLRSNWKANIAIVLNRLVPIGCPAEPHFDCGVRHALGGLESVPPARRASVEHSAVNEPARWRIPSLFLALLEGLQIKAEGQRR
jgi:hypothetical protein